MHAIVARRYLKKPDAVEALQVTNGNINFVANWCGGWIISGPDLNDPSKTYLGLDIPLADWCNVRVHIGDYVVREVSGRFTKLTNAQFLAEYEPESAAHRLRDFEAQHVQEMQNHRADLDVKVANPNDSPTIESKYR